MEIKNVTPFFIAGDFPTERCVNSLGVKITNYKLRITNYFDASPKQVSECLNAFRPLVSLELGIGEERETQLQEILPDERISTQEYVTLEYLRSDLQDLLATLKPNQRLVLILQFGLEGEGKLTAKQVA
ncbi:sigma-70 domain-containing protein [Nostoc sp. FACHB-888]|uniref:sigma-70 domain-containing protein n=1 Tax=Nostoc sp. FACHB-888 TaxID=2692842 RepID=UPI001683CACC|nr:sigma-70 domain-containing protein [Nostoc sp. FACHB-888]MBD2248264.1 hypothetical protein [Nostoc sp. FACHB-888]